jgi:hypothetical protein
MTRISRRLAASLNENAPAEVTVILRHSSGSRERLRTWVEQTPSATLISDLPFDLLVVTLPPSALRELLCHEDVVQVDLDEERETATFQFTSLLSAAQRDADDLVRQLKAQ